MRTRIMLFVFAILFCGNLFAQTVTVHLSGTITRDSTGVPVQNHLVIIRADSNAYGFDFSTTRTTGENGMYDCVIQDVPATGAAVIFLVKTENCDGTFLMETFPASNNPVTIDFILCEGSSGNCEADFEYEADSIHDYLFHFFDASYPQGEIASWKWAFGDPGSGSCNTTTLQNPTHTFSTSGTFNVCMTIISNSGCSHSRCHEIHVGNNPGNCESWFTYDANFLSVQFEGHTNSNFPTTYTWKIGDPLIATLTGIAPSFTFPAQGSYPVRLVTEDSTGCEFSYTHEVSVHSTCIIRGRVYADSLFVDHGVVDLIRIESGSMIVVDSQEINDSLGKFIIDGVLPGNYYLKASLLPTSQYFGQFLSTYYLHSATWSNAFIIELGQPEENYNIELIPLLNYSSGPGMISGVISQNAKFNSGAVPAPGVEIILFNTDNDPLSYATSDQDGKFEFADMALGSYSIYPEMTGKNTTPAAVILDNTNPSVTTSFTIQGSNILGVAEELETTAVALSEIFPTPSTEKANIRISVPEKREAVFSIYHITGQLASEFRFPLEKGLNNLSLPVRNLANGLYYIKIKDDKGIDVIRKMVIRK